MWNILNNCIQVLYKEITVLWLTLGHHNILSSSTKEMTFCSCSKLFFYTTWITVQCSTTLNILTRLLGLTKSIFMLYLEESDKIIPSKIFELIMATFCRVKNPTLIVLHLYCIFHENCNILYAGKVLLILIPNISLNVRFHIFHQMNFVC